MQRSGTFADRLKEYRAINELTLAEMETLTDVPAQTLNRYELKKRIPKIDTALEIAEALKINPLWLFGYNVGMEKVEDPVTRHELLLLAKYRKKEAMQSAVNKLLDIEPEEPTYNIAKAARSQQALNLTPEQLQEFAKSADAAPNRSQDKDLF